jgi:hypothetical protein
MSCAELKGGDRNFADIRINAAQLERARMGVASGFAESQGYGEFIGSKNHSNKRQYSLVRFSN